MGATTFLEEKRVNENATSKRGGRTMIGGGLLFGLGALVRVSSSLIMMDSFEQIAEAEVAPKPAELAEGISQAVQVGVIGNGLLFIGFLVLAVGLWRRLFLDAN